VSRSISLRSAPTPRLAGSIAPHPELEGWTPESIVWVREDSDYFDWGDEAGELCWTFPVFDERGELIDFIAWKSDRPARWWLHTGAALVTAPWLWRDAREWLVAGLTVEPPALRLVSSPEEWVADARQTSCILQPRAFDLAYELQRIPLIQCSEDLQAFLSAEIRRQVMKNIKFERPGHAPDPRLGPERQGQGEA
jgi:hypothetical protein